MHKEVKRCTELYKGNEFAMGRLAHHLSCLRSIIEAEIGQRADRERRLRNMEDRKNEFVERFMRQNRYYYMSHNEVFVIYDGTLFMACSEDDIQHEILEQITRERSLRTWKYKVKLSILKEIRQRSPFEAIPEPGTIQKVLGLLSPLFFGCRSAAKHFLAVVGDCISPSRTSGELVYLCAPQLKPLIRALGVDIFALLGHSTALHQLKLKHHEHDYRVCRILAGTSLPAPAAVRSAVAAISRESIGFLCVARHYSSRFGGAEGFLRTGCIAHTTRDRVMKLARCSPDSIVDRFATTCIQSCEGATGMNMEEMLYIWNKFLTADGLPAVMFHASLKEKLRQRLDYDETKGMFVSVTSPYLPEVARFLAFWEEAIYEAPHEEDLEIEELQVLYSLFLGGRGGAEGMYKDQARTTVLELIQHFHPDALLEDGSGLHPMLACRGWNKRETVVAAVAGAAGEAPDVVSLHAAYEAYVRSPGGSGRPPDLCVSKSFFDKVCLELAADSIITIGQS